MRSDFVVLLAAPAEWNAALVGKDEIQLMKKGAGLICLTDPQIFRWEELVRALDWGYLEYFAIDLPRNQAALARDVSAYGRVTVAEAANTREARIEGQVELAQDVVAALSGAQVDTATNIARVHTTNLREGSRWCALGRLLGVFMGQRLETLPDVLEIEESGALPVTESDAVVASVLAGFAEGLGEKKINFVNSRLWAEDKGLTVALKQNASALKAQLRLSVETPTRHLQVAGDRAGDEDNIVQVDDYFLQGHPARAHSARAACQPAWCDRAGGHADGREGCEYRGNGAGLQAAGPHHGAYVDPGGKTAGSLDQRGKSQACKCVEYGVYSFTCC